MTIKRKDGLVLRQSANFRLVERAGYYWLECLRVGSQPRARRVSKRDINYLVRETGASFDAACVMDFGVGVFAKGGAR